MKISSKSWKNWLVGGLATIIFALLGIKVSDIINFTWKKNYFKKVKQEFLEKGPPGTLIDWENDEDWNDFYKQQLEKQKNYIEIARTPEDFRDYCYSKVEEGAKKSFEDCYTKNGWCLECLKREKR